MQNEKNQPFIRFLKNHFKLSPITDAGFSARLQAQDALLNREAIIHHPKRKVAQNNVLRNIIKGYTDDETGDIDDQSAKNWQGEFYRHLSRLIFSRDKKAPKNIELDYFLKNQGNKKEKLNEIALVLAEKSQQAKQQTEEKMRAVPWAAKMATNIALALVLAISIARAAPRAGDAIINASDSMIIKPVITLGYLFAGPEIMAKIDPAVQPADSEKLINRSLVNKNYLGSYIVNNQAELKKNFSDHRRIIVSRDELDGRVAGVMEENRAAVPSPELLEISRGKEHLSSILIDEIGDLLDSLEKKQIEYSKILGNKLSN